jgi:hypothetical protein
MKRLAKGSKGTRRGGANEVEHGQSFDNPVVDTFDVEGGTARRGLPAFDSESGDQSPGPASTGTNNSPDVDCRSSSHSDDGRAIVPPETQEPSGTAALTDDELSDLAFAFQACDSDEDGWIKVEDLRAIFVALGADISSDQVRELVVDAKLHFREWLHEHVQGENEYPEYMMYNGVEPGHHSDTKHGGQRHFHLPNVGKPVETLKKSGQLVNKVGSTVVTATGASKVANVTVTGASKVVNVAGAAPGAATLKTGVRGGATLGKRGVNKVGEKVAKNAPVFNRAVRNRRHTAVGRIDESELAIASADDVMILASATLGKQGIEEELLAAMADPTKLIYAEYVLMATGNLWTKYVKTDWHKMAWKMRLLRNCYGE